MTTFEMPRINDMHVHFRQGPTVEIAKFHNPYADHVMVMPNLDPPIETGFQAMEYQEQILRQAPDLKPLMTIYLTPRTTPEIIRHAKKLGVVAAKLYPHGVTTGSDSGILNLKQIDPALTVMESVGMVLSIHPESPHPVQVLYREESFLSDVDRIRMQFPRLRVVLEHITTRKAVDFVTGDRGPGLAATITPHHLLLTLDDVIGDRLEPRNFCKPIAKMAHDQRALRNAVASADPKFFLGSDSAPHQARHKFCDHGCAGVFTAPILPGLLLQIFDDLGCRHRLRDFASCFGADFYGLPQASGKITLTDDPNYHHNKYDPLSLDGLANAVTLRGETGVAPTMEEGVAMAYPVFQGPAGFELKWKQVLD